MKIRKKIGDLGKEQIQQLVQDFIDELDEGAVALLEHFEESDNPEFLEVEVDEEQKILSFTRKDGSHYAYNLSSETIDALAARIDEINSQIEATNERIDNLPMVENFENIEDPEGRLQIGKDSEDKVYNYRKPDGTLVENVGIETNHLELTEQGMNEFQKDLINSGFTRGFGDFSNYMSTRHFYEYGKEKTETCPLHLPIPILAAVNLIVDYDLRRLSKKGRYEGVENVNYDIPGYIEYWDMVGNYFKKPVLVSGQGNASLEGSKKNIAIDLFDSDVRNSKGKIGKGDSFSVKFGNWVPQDSFHLKANPSTNFRFLNDFAYKYYNEIVKTRGIEKDYMWKKGIGGIDTIPGSTNVDKDLSLDVWESGAMCFPDGFPIVLYHNGEFWGLYNWNLKKHRDNFNMGKSNADHIHIDGVITDETLFVPDGHLDWELICGNKIDGSGRIDGFEVRNPKDLYCINVSVRYVLVTDLTEIELLLKKRSYSQTYLDCTEDMTIKTEEEIKAEYPTLPSYFHNVVTNEFYRIEETQIAGASKYDSDTNNHELIDDSMSALVYNPSNKDHVRTNNVKRNIEAIAGIMHTVREADAAYEASEKTAEDLEAFKEVFETYFDVENLTDYSIFGDVVDNWDGFNQKNWQWFTYNGEKMYVGVYDCELILGYNSSGNIVAPKQTHLALTTSTHTVLMNEFLFKYYNDAIELRYKELRDKGIISVEFITGLLKKYIDAYGKDNYEREWKMWSSQMPYDNIYRVRKWLVEKISITDSLYNYNS